MGLLLESKTAVIYGGGGTIGSAVARAFVREGADVHVVGRTQQPLDAVEGAQTAIVDALDEAQVEAHADSVGRIDVSLNVITHPYTHGTAFADLTVDEFMAPPQVALRSNFITARAAVRRMVKQRSGVVLFFGGTGPPMIGYHLGATQVAFDGMESLRRLISAEAGRQGVRAVSLITGGIFEGENLPQEVIDGALEHAMLPRTGTLEDVGNAAVFAASDMGSALTAATVNISCGAIVDF
jgi:NAD(P)-dependent dehydrogenase (short-subunit alcohol dehydrogenase family)